MRWRWVLFGVATVGWWAGQPAQTHAAEAVGCTAIRHPEKVNVTSQLHFRQRNPDFVEARQVTSIEVPKEQWGLWGDLTLSAGTKHKHALYCLLHRDIKTHKGFDNWNPEWRSTDPQTSEQKDLATVQYESWNLIKDSGGYEVGPWTVDVKADRDWAAALHSPDALRGASWKVIEVHPGGMEISDTTPLASSANKDSSRVWIGNRPNVKVDIAPPKSLALSRHVAFIASLGVVSWWVCASAVIAVSAWPFLYLRRTAGDPKKAAVGVLATTVLQWAGLSAALGLTLLLLLRPSLSVNPWRVLIGILSGLTLVLLARPWLPLAQGSQNSHRGLKASALVIAASAAAAAAISLLVVRAPHLFGLPPNLMPTARPPALGVAGLFLLNVSILWLWLTAIAAWAWRFAREGRLIESPTASGPEHPLRRIAAIGAGLAVIAVVVMACRYRSFENRWNRANWLGEARDLFGADHLSVLSRQLADFASRGPQWMYGYTWILAGVALVALLHSSSQTNPENSLGPQGWDLLLVTAVFAIVVALRGTKFAGSTQSVYGLWLPLNMLVLYAVVMAGRRWSVLGRVDRKAGSNCLVAELSTPMAYQRLMEDAYRCRDLVRRLRVADQGNAEDTTRQNLEEQLRSLHHWQPTGRHHDCLPETESVVDVAFSWGPGLRWWNNALTGARWAAFFGIVPSMVAAWYLYVSGAQWILTVDSPTGIPDTVGKFLSQEVSYAGAGLVLGALWRVLPGERGPMRAFNLFIAWLIPIGVIAVRNVSENHRELGLEVLNVVLMLTVLTLTSMWMDTETFSHERQYGTKRLGLLTSAYAVHGLSGQIAYLVAQVGAMVAIWATIVTHRK